MSEKELQIVEKKKVETSGGNTRNVPVFAPAVDICESENELILLADMPGTPLENVDIHLLGNQLTIGGRTLPGSDHGGKVLLREYREGDYFRQFTLPQAVDREKIEASMKDGVLKVVLPKIEAAKPRKIKVMAS